MPTQDAMAVHGLLLRAVLNPILMYGAPGGQTTDSIFNQCGGSYCSIITDNNGCVDTACVTVNMTTGIVNNSSPSSGIVIYPNPSKGIFTMQWSVVRGQWSVEVYNVLGQQVFSNYQITKLSNYQIDLSAQPNGIYLYKAESESGNVIDSGKLVIEK